jgi:hypothetical protein
MEKAIGIIYRKIILKKTRDGALYYQKKRKILGLHHSM